MRQGTSNPGPNPIPTDSVDKEKLQDSLDRLFEIYREIGQVADQVSTWRCPYKDRNDRCTARFACRNQTKTAGDELPLCTGSDKLNYRDAWEV